MLEMFSVVCGFRTASTYNGKLRTCYNGYTYRTYDSGQIHIILHFKIFQCCKMTPKKLLDKSVYADVTGVYFKHF